MKTWDIHLPMAWNPCGPVAGTAKRVTASILNLRIKGQFACK